MTGGTRIGHGTVIHRDSPAGCAMTAFTFGDGVDVRRVFADCHGAIMARRTQPDNFRVINLRCYPANCHMAGIAIVTGRNMRRRLRGSGCSIMAGFTSSHHRRVINRIGCPVRGGMTKLAIMC